MSKVPSREHLEGGPCAEIWGVKTEDGSCPARDWLQSLNARAQAQFKARFEALVATGTLRTPDYMRRLNVDGKPPVFEIKADEGPGWRLYLIRVGRDWYATHGCKKPKDRKVKREAENARKIFATGGGSE